MGYNKTTGLVMICVLMGFFSLNAQNIVTVNPTEYPGGLCNPLKGFRKDLNSADDANYPYTAIVRHYIKWNEIENSSQDGVQKIIDYCNDKWKGLEDLNIKVIPRVYVEWHDENGDEYWPADIVDSLGWDTWDNRYWKSELVKERMVNLIHKLGEAWDYDPRVAWIQTGLIGYWGEQENPIGVDEEGWSDILGEAFQEAFKNKKLLVRNQDDWADDKFGVYWDSYGHPGQRNGSWKSIQNENAQGRYLSQIIEGEVAYGWGESSFDPVYGGEPEITLNDYGYTNSMIDVIKELHCTGLGWIASYDLDGSNGTNPDSVRANASKMQKEFGYRFVIPEFSCPKRSEPGESMNMNFKVVNKGSAPFYEDWPLAFVLIHETTHEIVYTQELSDYDITSWHPGSNYSYSTRSYSIPAKEHEISITVNVPGNIDAGQYMAGISILEPHSKTPGIFFSMENFLEKSQTQPLCRVGIGMDVTDTYEIDPSIFDDPVKDDKRKYTLDPIGPTFSLNIESSEGGSVKPNSSEIEQNRTITLQARPEIGFVFTDWSGDISGNTNPVQIAMDSDKNIKANFSAAPPETLPWFETFDIKEGNTSNAGPTSWMTTRLGGKFEVDNQNRLFVNDAGEPGEFSTGNIDISQDSVVISMDISGAGGLDESGGSMDFIKIYTVIDDGSEELVYEDSGKNPNQLYVKNITGSTLRLIIRTKVTASDEFYFFDNLLIKYDVPGNNYKLTTNATNGSISLSPPGGTYEEGMEVALTAIPDNGYRFASWSGDLSGSANPAIIHIDENKEVTANFESVPTFTLTTHIQNGNIKLNPEGGTYEEGTKVTIVVTPEPGYVFAGWSGDLTHSNNPTAITMDGNKEITAITEKIQAYTLTINALNGSVLILPEKDFYTPGSAVVIKVSPDEGYEFTGWEGSLSGNANPTSIIMNEDKTLTAVITPVTALNDIENSGGVGLLQNYPNPFSNQTTIYYNLNKASNVNLTVYNFLGQKITTLINEFQIAGEHSVTWEVGEKNNHQRNGLFLFKLKTGNGVIRTNKASMIR